MSILFYNFLHIIGLLLLISAAIAWFSISQIKKELLPSKKRLILSLHGSAVFLILFSGFGQMARLGIYSNWPMWINLKLAIWIILGLVLPFLFFRTKAYKGIFYSTVLLILIATVLGIFKLL